MKTVVIYDSAFGNTAMIARRISAILGMHTPSQVMSVKAAGDLVFEPGDVLVVGSPTQAWSTTPTLLAWLLAFQPGSLKGVAVAAFDTRFQKPRWLTGSAARKIATVTHRIGATLLMPAESFFVQGKEGPLVAGELERAETWTEALFQEIQRYEERFPTLAQIR